MEVFGGLTFEDGTDRLTLNVGKKMTFLAALKPKKCAVLSVKIVKIVSIVRSVKATITNYLSLAVICFLRKLEDME